MWFSKETLSGSFKKYKLLKRIDVCAFLFKKGIIRRDFFCNTKSLFTELAFSAQLLTNNLSE